MKLLEIQQLSCQFGNTTVLEKLDLAVAENEIVCLLGASGCGKTTLLKIIAGLVPNSEGNIWLSGQNLARKAVEDRKIGLIFQDYALFPHLTVAENVGFGLSKLAPNKRLDLIEKMLEVVKLQGLEERYPHQLSGGQQQRVAIARALACQPELLLLDEPFSNIDSQTRFAMISEIKQILKSQNVPAIFVTHSKEEAFAFADKIAVMDQGKIVQFSSPENLYHQPINPFVADFLGGTNYLDCEVLAEQQIQSVIGTHQFENLAYPQGCYRWLIRPEQIRMVLNEQGQGIIREKMFLGHCFRYKVEIGNDILMIDQNSDFPLEQKIAMNIQQQNLVLFKVL